MSILLAAATIAEIEPFVQYYREEATAFDDVVDIVVTGVGLTAATYALTRHIHTRKPGLIVQAGVAGAYDHSIALGTVVTVKQDTFADLGVDERNTWKTVFDLGLAAANRPPYHKGWLVNKNEILKQIKLKPVRAVSINQVTTSKKAIGYYTERFDPAIETMEGAALHYVCLSEKIPFLQLRSISNYIGERNKKNWELKKSITNLNNQLIRLLKSI